MPPSKKLNLLAFVCKYITNSETNNGITLYTGQPVSAAATARATAVMAISTYLYI